MQNKLKKAKPGLANKTVYIAPESANKSGCITASKPVRGTTNNK